VGTEVGMVVAMALAEEMATGLKAETAAAAVKRRRRVCKCKRCHFCSFRCKCCLLEDHTS